MMYMYTYLLVKTVQYNMGKYSLTKANLIHFTGKIIQQLLHGCVPGYFKTKIGKPEQAPSLPIDLYIKILAVGKNTVSVCFDPRPSSHTMKVMWIKSQNCTVLT